MTRCIPLVTLVCMGNENPKIKAPGVTTTTKEMGTHKTGRTTQIAVRIPNEMLVRIEAYAGRLGSHPGALRGNFADAVRALLDSALDRVEADRRRRVRRK